MYCHDPTKIHLLDLLQANQIEQVLEFKMIEVIFFPKFIIIWFNLPFLMNLFESANSSSDTMTYSILSKILVFIAYTLLSMLDFDIHIAHSIIPLKHKHRIEYFGAQMSHQTEKKFLFNSDISPKSRFE